MSDFLKLFGFWGALLLAIFGVVWWFFSDLVSNAPSRHRMVGWLLEDTPNLRYRALLSRGLDWIDDRLSGDRGGLPDSSARVAWSHGLLNFNLMLGLGYPVLSLLVAWVISNNGSIGGAVLIPPEPNDLVRYSVAAAFCGLVGALIYAELRLKGRRKHVVRLVSIYLWIALAGTVAGTVAVVAAGVAAGVGVGVGVGAFAVAVAGAVAVAFALAVAVAVAFSGAVAVDILSRRVGRPGLLLWLWTVTGLLGACTLVTMAPGLPERPNGSPAAMILFLSLLPLLNALADFASCGLTRYWLRRGVAGNLLWAGVRDAFAGAVLFLVLGCAVIATVHFVRPQDGRPLADIGAVFAGLADPATRGSYWWLGLMLFSTLIPTVLHAVVAILAFFTLAPHRWRHATADQLIAGAAGDDMAGKWARANLAVEVTVAIWLPVFVLWYAFTLRFGGLDDAIWLFRGFAVGIGAMS